MYRAVVRVGDDLPNRIRFSLRTSSATIFRLVRAIDPNAFVSQSQVRGVFGQGFDPMINGK